MVELAKLKLEEFVGHDWRVEAGEKVRSALREDKNGSWSKLHLPLLGNKVESAVGEAVDSLDLLSVLAQGCSKLREVWQAESDKTAFIQIGKFKFERDLHPVVTISFAPWVSDDIRFTLTLRAKLNAVEIEVLQRRIRGIGGGTCELGVELKYGPHSLTGPSPLKTFDLPLDHRFEGEGIAFDHPDEPSLAQPVSAAT
jgi:hypothetical protein